MPILKQKSQFKGLSVFMHKLISSFDLAKGFQDDTDVSIIQLGELEELLYVSGL